MLSSFKQHISDTFPMLLKRPFLLACSGGVDSVVLAHLCSASKLEFALAHCNFKLRAEASDEDAAFVAGLAKNLNVEFFVKDFETNSYVENNKVSVQMAARTLRYRWFKELMQTTHYNYLITAHHADDNLETFLINLSRGTGIDGLSGIPEKTETIGRPLLPFSREEILSYAKQAQITWREDASNADTKYLRNKIRHELVPKLKELHPTFEKNFRKTQKFLAGTTEVLDAHIVAIKDKLFVEKKGHYALEVSELMKLKPLKPYLYLLFKEYGFGEWDNVHDLLTAMSGKEVRSGTHRLIKSREVILLQELSDKEQDRKEYFLDSDDVLPLNLRQTEVEVITETSDTILYIDKETLNDRLSVRKWKNGDY
ncbi:MAG: tRNA lysidine(34) synthetase TilS, partial [Flavobacteriaceae bacterium]